LRSIQCFALALWQCGMLVAFITGTPKQENLKEKEAGCVILRQQAFTATQCVSDTSSQELCPRLAHTGSLIACRRGFAS
jgi:hypothetical protein